MNRNTVAAFMAGGVLAGAIAIGFGAHAAPAVPLEDAASLVGAAALAHPGPSHGQRRGPMGRRAAMLRALEDPALATIVNLRALERIYRHEGRADDVEALYRDVLAKTDNATVRNFANLRLARIAMRGKDAKAAQETLQRNLQENLARLR
jgi:predicted negative regulator of RcsB-dependent stress response